MIHNHNVLLVKIYVILRKFLEFLSTNLAITSPNKMTYKKNILKKSTR